MFQSSHKTAAVFDLRIGILRNGGVEEKDPCEAGQLVHLDKLQDLGLFHTHGGFFSIHLCLHIDMAFFDEHLDFCGAMTLCSTKDGCKKVVWWRGCFDHGSGRRTQKPRARRKWDLSKPGPSSGFGAVK